MDLESRCKDKLLEFRIKELKDVLTKLGLSKQGKKQELIDRISTLLSEEKAGKLRSKKNNTLVREEVVKLVDDAYRKIRNDLIVKGEETEEDSEMKVRCVCGSSLETESMIQCEDVRCRIWEHVGCVSVPEKTIDGLPESFYCEICRLTRADPFLVTVANPLSLVRLTVTTNSMQSVDKTFQITRADKDLLAKKEYDIQAWCMLLNDKVRFRMHWPQYADLQVNGVPIRVINRPGSQLLGANGRDDGPIITPCIREGINRISLSGSENRSFCFGVRLVKRRTLQQVLNLIPEENKGEMFEDALARVRRCIGGGSGGGDDNGDSDSDIEVVADFFTNNLRCPMSGSRIKVAGRFLPCVHMGCFDLEVFVEMNQRSRKWQCPICLKNYSVEHVVIDPYFNRITSQMKRCDIDVTEVELKPDGSWRVKSKKDMGELSQWHPPDSKMEMLTPVKQEGDSDGPTGSTPLKLGIKKNRDGVWEVSKPNSNGLSSSNKDEKNIIIPLSSDEVSVNQDVIGNNEVIVLTDSDEEEDNDVAITSELNVPLDVVRSLYGEEKPQQTVAGGGSSGLGLFHDDTEEFDWSFCSESPEAPPGFELFTSNAEVSKTNGGLVDNPVAYCRYDDHTLQRGLSNDDWISLRVGDSALGNQGDAATTANGVGSSKRMSKREDSLDTKTETGREENGKKRSSTDRPFTVPRQKRSCRPRVFLSIDSDSE